MNKFIIFLFIIILIIIIYYIYKKRRNYESYHVDKLELIIKDFYPKQQNSIKSQKIPFKIHQTYKSNDMDVNMYESCLINKNMNPEYDYYYHNDDNIKKFIEKNYSSEYMKAYQKIKPGAFKADLFRYLLLYIEGGVYIDCKSYTIEPLRDFIPSDSDFVSFKDRPFGTIMNGFIACTPKNPILKICIEMTIDNILNEKYGINCLDVTGPQVLGRAYNKYRGKEELSEIDIDSNNIIGSFITIGDNSYQALADKNNFPLINRVCQNYYSILNYFNTYGFNWKIGNIF